MSCKIHFIFIIEFQGCKMMIFKLLMVSAVILFASSYVNAAVIDHTTYTADKVSHAAGLALGE